AILYTARAWPRWHEPAGGTAAMRNRRFTRNSASRRRWLGAGPRRPGRESSTGGRVDLRAGLRLEHDPPQVSGRRRDDLGARAGDGAFCRHRCFVVRVGGIIEAWYVCVACYLGLGGCSHPRWGGLSCPASRRSSKAGATVFIIAGRVSRCLVTPEESC